MGDRDGRERKKSLRVFLAFFSAGEMERAGAPVLPSALLLFISLRSFHFIHACSPHTFLPPRFTPVHLAMSSLPVDAQTGVLHTVLFLLFLFFLSFHVSQIHTNAAPPPPTIKLTISSEFLEAVDLLLGTGQLVLQRAKTSRCHGACLHLTLRYSVGGGESTWVKTQVRAHGERKLT